MRPVSRCLCVWLGLTVAGSVWAQGPDIEGLIASLSAPKAELRLDAARELAKLGAKPLNRLLAVIAMGEQPAATGATVAVDALVQNAAALKDGEERASVARVLVAVAEGGTQVGIRRYALRQLSLVGGEESVAPLSRLMKDPQVGEMARWALARIPGRAALQALLVALRTAPEPMQVGILNALGERGDTEAVEPIAEVMGGAPASVRTAAIAALGHLPSVAAEKVLRPLLTRGSKAERRAARAAYLQLSELLLACGMIAEAEAASLRAYREFPELQDRCAGLAGYAKAAGERAVPALLDAIEAGPADLRGVAMHALAEMPGAGVTPAVIAAMGGASGEAREALLWVVGRRGDGESSTAASAALRSTDERVQLAALRALAALRDPATAEAILAALRRGSERVRAAAEAALARVPGDEATVAIANAVATAEPAVRVILVRSLGLRPGAVSAAALSSAAGDADEAVRMACIDAMGRLGDVSTIPALLGRLDAGKEAEWRAAQGALTAMRSADATEALRLAASQGPETIRARVIEALGNRGDAGLYDAFVVLASDPSDAVGAAALDALGKLRDMRAEPVLRRFIQEGTTPKRAAAIRGYLQLGQSVQQKDPGGALAVYLEALDLAPGDAERRLALDRIAEVGEPRALPAVMQWLEKGSPEVAKSAASAAIAIGGKLAQTGQREQAIELLKRAVALSDNREAVRAGAAQLRALGVPLELAKKDGYITHFWVCGPIGSRDELTKSDALDPARPIDLAVPVRMGDVTRSWRFAPVDDPSGLLDLEKAAARQDNTGAYAYSEITVDQAQDVVLKVGSDDDVFVWVNGKLAGKFVGNRGWTADQDTYEAHLEAGRNTVLLKVLNGGAQWSASCRVLTRDGKPADFAQLQPGEVIGLSGLVSEYWVAAPLPGHDALLKQDALDTTKPVDTSRAVSFGGQSVPWRYTTVGDASGVLNLEAMLGALTDVGAYAYAEVESDRARDVLLKIGSDDEVFIWLNGELVHANETARPVAPDQDTAEAHLEAGVNRVLCKVLQQAGGWGLVVRITDRDGKPIAVKQPRP